MLDGGACWQKEGSEQPFEADLLKLDCSKAYSLLGWTPKWDLETAIQKIVQWQKAYQTKENMRAFSLAQINNYISSVLSGLIDLILDEIQYL